MSDVYDAFGFRRGDPFLAAPRFEWTGLKRIVRDMWRLARNREWGLWFAPPGSGKTEAKNAFCEQYCDKAWIVEVKSTHRRVMRMNCLLDAMIMDLDMAGLGERPTYRREGRTRQIVRLLGQRSEEKPVLVILDEASAFSQDLFNNIKHLRDLVWVGRRDKGDRRPHFGVVMFGWVTLAKRIAAVRQNEIRVRRREAPPMSFAELCALLDHVGWTRKKLPEASRAALHACARYPGEARFALQGAMERALLRGRRVIEPEDLMGDVEALAATVKRLHIYGREIAALANTSVPTVSQVLSGSYTGRERTRAAVLLAARRLIREDPVAQESRRPSQRRSA